MKEIKKIRIIAVVAFLVAIASLSISYSSLNTTKEVKGIAMVEPNVISLKISDINNLLCDEGSSISDVANAVKKLKDNNDKKAE